jgi:DNA-binding beta-propeller fold protein YncE
MKKFVLIAVFGALLFTGSAQQIYQSERLVRKWETPAELKVPESVYYDTARQVLYVSNVTGSPTDKDGTGFISKISPEGKILELQWVTGLNAPKGLGVSGEFLYVSDISRVVKINIATGKITEQVEIPGSQFLNDIATDSQGNVYVSDMNGKTIYVIRGGSFEVLVKSDKVTGVNGLFVVDGNLLAGLQDRIVSINLRTKEIKDCILNTGGIDGLVPDGNGNYLISDWLGNIHQVSTSKEKEKLLDTTPANIYAADIDYVPSKKMLLVPTFSDNRVVAYELK